MPDGETIIAGIAIPSTSPLFLSVVGLHVLVGLGCTAAGIVAMLSTKGRGRHSNFGTIYYWCLIAVFVTATGLSRGNKSRLTPQGPQYVEQEFGAPSSALAAAFDGSFVGTLADQVEGEVADHRHVLGPVTSA